MFIKTASIIGTTVAVIMATAATFLIQSCSTTASNFSPVAPSNQLLLTMPTWEQTCFANSSSPQFQAEISSTNLTPITLDGAWNQNFSAFSAEISGPFGTPIASLQVQELLAPSWTVYRSVSAEVQEHLAKIAGAIATIGPKNLRAILCGTHWHPQPNHSLLVKNEVSTAETLHTSLYRSTSNLSTSHGLIRLDSTVFSSRNSNAAIIKAESEASTGIIFRKSIATITWQGTVQPHQVTPSLIKVQTGNTSFQLDFFDFE